MTKDNVLYKPIHFFSDIYDGIFSHKNVVKVERSMMILAIILFVLHIGLIFINKNFENAPWIFGSIEANYLSSIATPFTIILIFEIFLLVTSIPKSLSKSIARQYEVVSLVFIRRVFKDISELENLTEFVDQSEIYRRVIIDMSGALGLFFLIVIFYFITRAFREDETHLDRVVQKIKKMFSYFLILVLLGLGTYYLMRWSRDLFFNNANFTGNYIEEFFENFFVIMIFVDIIIVIISFIYKEKYAMIFKDAGFIISVIFMRLSFTTQKPFDIVISLVGIIFGIVTAGIFRLYRIYKATG